MTNYNLLLDLKCFGGFFVLNLWMCALNGPFWTGLTESDNPWTCCGRIIDSECYGVVCSVWGAERIMRLYHSINTEWHHGAHKRAVVGSATWLGQIAQTIFFKTCLVWNTFPTLSRTQSKPSSPFPEKNPCARECVRVRKKTRCEMMFCSTNAL